VKLGNYLELTLSVKDRVAAVEYYEKLGFKRLDGTCLTDGSINLRVMEGRFASPSLSYYGSDVQGIKSLFSKVKKKKNDDPAAAPSTSGEFKDPSGTRITITVAPSKLAMPAGTPTQRTPISLCGKFGELTIPCENLAKSVFFWGLLGFEPLNKADIPYPYAMLSDGYIVIGLHQSDFYDDIYFTYFADDMPERIQRLRDVGIDVLDMVTANKGDTSTNAGFVSPDGQKFFLFKGAI